MKFKKSKGLSFPIFVMSMIVIIILVWLYFTLFTYHISLTVRDSYVFNKYKHFAMTLYNTMIDLPSGKNGCDSSTQCKVPLVFDLSTISFKAGSSADYILLKLKELYEPQLREEILKQEMLALVNPIATIGVKAVCIFKTASGLIDAKTDAACTSSLNDPKIVDLSIVYPFPLVYNKVNNIENLLIDLRFKIKT